MTHRGSPGLRSGTRTAALLVAAVLVPACGRPAPPSVGAATEPSSRQAPSADDLAQQARRHLDEAERIEREAGAARDEGDARLSGGVEAGARDAFVEAGRLYAAADAERRDAYAAADAARAAWSADAKARCRTRRASAEESQAPGR